MSKWSALNSSFETIDWGIDTTGFEFVNASKMVENKPYQLKGVYISKDRGYGNGAVAILEDRYVNLPKSCLDKLKTVLADHEMIDDIKAGKISIKFSSYESKKYKTKATAVEFISK